ncbi:GH116 family glycosyl hydrolase [Flavitalea flava]
MKLLFLTIAIALLHPVFGQQSGPTDPSHFVPVKKELSPSWEKSLWDNARKIYKGKELTTIGMPCGGIAAGQLYVRGDGTLANWWIANNAYNTGYGIDWLMNFGTEAGPWKVCYQTFEPFSYIDQGFAVTIKQNNVTRTRQLNKKDFDDISFTGEYPVARITYSSVSNPLPLQIDATVYSPFIPLNAKESATPGTILRYRLKNTSSEKMQVSLTGWLQNLICIDLKDRIEGALHNKVIREEGRTTIAMDLQKGIGPQPFVARKDKLFQDFETGSYGKWKAEGTAFGKKPITIEEGKKDRVTGGEGEFLIDSKLSGQGDSATGKLISPVFIVGSDFINFKLAGGSYKDNTCMNLVVDGKPVKSATGNWTEHLEDFSWNVKAWIGQKAYLEIIDKEKGSWGHINVDQIVFSNLPSLHKFFPDSHPYFGNLSLSVLDADGFADANYKGNADRVNNDNEALALPGEKLVGAAGTTIELAPGETREITFLLTWFFPNRPMQYGEGGNWNKPIPTGGPAIGNMYANWFDNSGEVASWLQHNLERLTRETFAFHDAYYVNSSLPYWLNQRLMMPVSTLATETCQWWATDKFWAWEGVGSCVGTCTHVWNYEQALAHLFPELEKNVREKTDFGTSFREDGGIESRNGWGGILIDGHAGAILKAYRENLLSKDNLFLSRNWSKIKKATEFIIKEDGNGDGLIEKEQANTYDIAFYGANTYVGGLYLASLKAASRMALLMKDSVFSSHCDSIFASGSRKTVDKLWNGEYFIQDVDLAKHPKYQYAGGCLSDQLFGQTWAHLDDLGYLYPENKVKTALESIWKYNWAPDVGVQTKMHKPERVYADPGEAGLLVATWPKSKHMGEDGVRYRDEVWTGIEYQVATNMIYEGMINEGLSLIRSVHERYSPEKHNPYNEIECGDHYARAMASWGVLLALQDFYYNGPEKAMRFIPKVQKDQFKSFFTASEGWGNIGQTRTAGAQTNTVSLVYGSLRLTSLEVELTGEPKKISIISGGRPVPFTTERIAEGSGVQSGENTGSRLKLKFSEQDIHAGESLVTTLGY